MFRSILYVTTILCCLASRLGQTLPAPSSSANSENEAWLQRFAQMQEYMNPTANPCNDFHEFVCGNFINKQKEKVEEFGFWDVLLEADAVMQEKMLRELQEMQANDTSVDRQLKIFYQSCVNTSIFRQELNEFLHQAIAAYGSMPAIVGDQWQEEDFKWQEVVARIKHDTGYGILLDLQIYPDHTDTSIRRVALVQPTFETIDEYYVSGYLDPDSDMTKQLVKELQEFGKALNNASQNVELTPPRELYAIMAIENVQKKYLRAWDSRRLINDSLGLDPAYVMIQPSYLNKLHRLLQETPTRIVANYIFASYLQIITKDIPPGSWPSQSICQELILPRNFESFMENMKYRKFLKASDKQGLLDIWHYLKRTLEETITSSQHLSWMRKETRQFALQKIEAMRLVIATFEDKNFAKEFQYLNFAPNDYLGNYKTILQWHGNQSRSKIYQKPQYRPPPTVVPSYTPEENIVYIPVATLNPGIFWSSLYPKAFSFARLGAIMSHEMLHGFDDVGRYFDARGNSLEWLDDFSAQEFEKRTECLRQQYENYTFGRRHLPRIERQAENIADNGGLHVAYGAYLKWFEEATTPQQEDEIKLALTFSPRQLFFISFGQVWCDSNNPENYFGEEHTDIHLPKEFRLLGSLSNFEPFAKEFNCPLGSTMNPKKKCKMY